MISIMFVIPGLSGARRTSEPESVTADLNFFLITSGGSITLTSGTAAEQPGFGALPVSICGAMNALTKALAFELAPIRVNAVAPGVVRTPLWDAMSEGDRQHMYDQAAQRLPLGRVGEVADTARAYLYCMEQGFGTGIVLTVDGGTVLV